MGEQCGSVSAYVKNRTVCRTVSERIRICRIKECKSESVQYRNTSEVYRRSWIESESKTFHKLVVDVHVYVRSR